MRAATSVKETPEHSMQIERKKTWRQRESERGKDRERKVIKRERERQREREGTKIVGLN